MRLFLIPFVLLAFAGCDQAAPDSARAKAETTNNGDGEGGEVSTLSSETFWFGRSGTFDAQFELTGGNEWSRSISVEMLDRLGNSLGTFQEARDHYMFPVGGEEQMAVSGPVSQNWPMMVCPTNSLDVIPEHGDPNCQVMAPNTTGDFQFMGVSNKNMTSVHHKPGRTIFDFTSDSGAPAVFFVPEQMPLPGEQPEPDANHVNIPSVNYVVMTPVGALSNYRPVGIKISWPSEEGREMQFFCDDVSHPGVNGTCSNSGPSRGTAGGF